MSETAIYLHKADILQSGIPVLHQVNMSVEKGQFAYLIGKTGSGKSSLLKTLYGELPLQAGEGATAGFDLTTLKRRQIPFLRRKLGIVFQDFQLLGDRNVMDNLLFVLQATGWKNKEQMRERALEVLKRVGLENKDYKMPGALSGGEQQRVVIARAILNHPEVILADEPTGNLDPDVSDDIVGLLHEICREGAAVLMATHDYRVIGKFSGNVFRTGNGMLEQVNYPH
ncbi:MAG: ATP-binding cassette domain-containing protein [Bacteroidetes bacterium]|nr:ATP-binding cassette domain-containing protein [Bacteroidota bacterium]